MARSDADRAREYRARRRDARDADRRAAARAAAESAGTEMRDAVEASIAAAKWLAPSDSATLSQLRATARIIDVAIAVEDVTLELSAHGRLSGLLNAAGMTPTSRMQNELRSQRAVPETADPGSLPANVQSITSPRPPKRTRS